MPRHFQAHVVAAAALATMCLTVVPASGQQAMAPSEWLDKLDREHDQMVAKAGHAHAKGQVESVDPGPGIVAILCEEIQSPDKTIWMPPMRMVFHVTNRRMLDGLKSGDAVQFEVARLRGAVMVTNIRKLR